MKKGPVLGVAVLTLALALLASGCAMKKSSYIKYEIKNEDGGVQQEVKFESLIEKYVREQGERYIANDYMTMRETAFRHSSEEWVDSDGRLKLPFSPDDFKVISGNDTHKIIYFTDAIEHYYIPDEIAANASTEELADVFISYGYNSGFAIRICTPRPMLSDCYEHEFMRLLSYSNALEESLRRKDFGSVYFERYMTESEDMPEYYEGGDDLLYFESANKTETLDLIEVLLAQPESYAQLAKEQRETLVRRVLEREVQGEQGKLLNEGGGSEYWTFFFACIAGECYLPTDMAEIMDTTGGLSDVRGAIRRDGNLWLETINSMYFTEDEQKILDKYFVRR